MCSTCYKLCTGTDRHELGLYNCLRASFVKQVAHIINTVPSAYQPASIQFFLRGP